MATKRGKIQNLIDVPPPNCSCGKPATHEMELTVRRLELQREAGVHSMPYWTAAYRGTVHHISAVLCSDCLARDVKVSASVSASMRNAEKKL